MSFTEDQVSSEVTKFTQGAQSLTSAPLGGKAEATAFLRIHELILLTIAAHPETLYYLRALGRNRLLANLSNIAQEIADLIIYIDAATRKSTSAPSTDQLSKASRRLNEAGRVAAVGGTVGSMGRSINRYRSALRGFTSQMSQNVSGGPVGSEARRILGTKATAFVADYTRFMQEFQTFTYRFAQYNVDDFRKRLTSLTLERTQQSLSLAGDYFQDNPDSQERARDYFLNLASGSAALIRIGKMRVLGQPIVRSPNPNAVDRTAIPAGTNFRGYVIGTTTPATLLGGKSPYKLTDPEDLELGANGGATAVVDIKDDDTLDIVISKINAAVDGLTASSETVTIGDIASDGFPQIDTGAFHPDLVTFEASVDIEALGVQVGDTLVVKDGPDIGKYTISSVSGTDAVVDSSAPVGSTECRFYVTSDRLRLTSDDETSSTALEVAAANGNTNLGLTKGAYYGIAQEFEGYGKDGESSSNISAKMKLLGVTEKDWVVIRNQSTRYRMQVTTVNDESLLVEAVDGYTPIPSNMLDVEFEVMDSMYEPSQALTSACRKFFRSRRNRPFSTLESLDTFQRQVGVAINTTQMKSKVRKPLQDLADLLVALTDDIPDQEEVESALARQGVSLPTASVVAATALRSYEDDSPQEIKARGEAVLQTLEDKGYDRGKVLLLTGNVTSFLSMTNRNASYGSAVLEGMKDVSDGLTRRRS